MESRSTSQQSYESLIRKKRLILWGSLLLTGLAALLAIGVGSIQVSLTDVFRTLLGKGELIHRTAILNIRLPRVTAAILVGASLASAGAVMQCVLRNPLASASTLGVSQGAAFGAALGIVAFGAGVVNSAQATSAITIINPAIVTLCAFFFGSLSTLIVLLISQLKKELGPAGLVLAGVALSSLFAGGSTLLQYFSDDTKLGAIVFWTFGNLGSVNWRGLSFMALVLGISTLFFYFNRWNYNAMEAGADEAMSLGVNTRQVMLSSLLVCSLLCAVAVSFVGIISFVGLVAPHIMRRIVGNDARFHILASAIGGALLLIIADSFGRWVLSPVILPIGALTAFLGAPIFLYLLFRKGRVYG